MHETYDQNFWAKRSETDHSTVKSSTCILASRTTRILFTNKLSKTLFSLFCSFSLVNRLMIINILFPWDLCERLCVFSFKCAKDQRLSSEASGLNWLQTEMSNVKAESGSLLADQNLESVAKAEAEPPHPRQVRNFSTQYRHTPFVLLSHDTIPGVPADSNGTKT